MSAIRITLPGSSGTKRSLIRSRSATRSTSSSSATPLSQLQKPIFGRTYSSISSPQSSVAQRNARPAGHPSRGKGQAISRQPSMPDRAGWSPATPSPVQIATANAVSRLRIWDSPVSGQSGRSARGAGQFQNMQAGIGAIDDVDISALIGFDIIGLDRDLAAFPAFDRDAPLVGGRRDRGDEIADLTRMIGIANVERPHAGIEKAAQDQPSLADRDDNMPNRIENTHS